MQQEENKTVDIDTSGPGAEIELENELINIAREAGHILKILPGQGKDIQGGRYLSSLLKTIKKKFPKIVRSEFQQELKSEFNQPLQPQKMYLEKDEGPHYRCDLATDRWVLIPSKQRRREPYKHGENLEKERKKEAGKQF